MYKDCMVVVHCNCIQRHLCNHPKNDDDDDDDDDEG